MNQTPTSQTYELSGQTYTSSPNMFTDERQELLIRMITAVHNAQGLIHQMPARQLEEASEDWHDILEWVPTIQLPLLRKEGIKLGLRTANDFAMLWNTWQYDMEEERREKERREKEAAYRAQAEADTKGMLPGYRASRIVRQGQVICKCPPFRTQPSKYHPDGGEIPASALLVTWNDMEHMGWRSDLLTGLPPSDLYFICKGMKCNLCVPADYAQPLIPIAKPGRTYNSGFAAAASSLPSVVEGPIVERPQPRPQEMSQEVVPYGYPD